ncbi:MAG: hypothetical protein ACREQE_08385 [Candidatus Binataceae bacterium]
MAHSAQYRCYFLDSTGSIQSDETIRCAVELDAVETARDLLEHKPHYHGIELWRGARRVHTEMRLPDIPAYIIRSLQRDF